MTKRTCLPYEAALEVRDLQGANFVVTVIVD